MNDTVCARALLSCLVAVVAVVASGCTPDEELPDLTGTWERTTYVADMEGYERFEFGADGSVVVTALLDPRSAPTVVTGYYEFGGPRDQPADRHLQIEGMLDGEVPVHSWFTYYADEGMFVRGAMVRNHASGVDYAWSGHAVLAVGDYEIDELLSWALDLNPSGRFDYDLWNTPQMNLSSGNGEWEVVGDELHLTQTTSTGTSDVVLSALGEAGDAYTQLDDTWGYTLGLGTSYSPFAFGAAFERVP